jgi:hypothetical protein
MGHLPNKAKNWATDAARQDKDERRKREGWTVFHFDFKPSLTRRDLTLGEAIRYLLRSTGSRMKFWRCPIRGLAVQIQRLPTTKYAYDHGYTYTMLHFSDLDDEVEAKKALVLDMLLTGIELFRGLPNVAFDEEIKRIKWLLCAPPSVSAEDWCKVRNELQKQSRPLLRTHEAELRFHLLGEKYSGPTGPVAMTVKVRLEEIDRRA